MHALILGPLLVVAIVANGLLAVCSLCSASRSAPASGRADDGIYVQAFQAINAAILNGRFLTVLFVAP